jgi:hypothetical protein
MSVQTLPIQALSKEHARLSLPPGLFQPAVQPPPLERFRGEATPGREALRTARRPWLVGLTGGALGVVPPGRPVSNDPLLTLMHRITFGFTLAEYERAQSLGYEGYLEEQLEPLTVDDSAMQPILALFPALEKSPKEMVALYSGSILTATRQVKLGLLARAVNSKRQLLERMCEFWLDHFSVNVNKGLMWALVPEYERTVIRPHALGRFPELLSACAFSAGMLYYLDNWLNERSAPQNNYARELLELHTLSVDGGYTNADVDEVARCFTGWTLNGDPDSPDYLRGVYDQSLHARGDKFVLGHLIASRPPVGRPASPVVRNNEAQGVLDILARHPSTAEFLSEKLIRHFLTPSPSAELVQRVAQTFRATDGDIKAMLRVILARPNLAAHSEVLAPKCRRPFHLTAALLRAMDGRCIADSSVALNHLQEMEHVPYDHVAPDGYPDGFWAWGPSLLPRWVFSSTLLRHNFHYFGWRLIDLTTLYARLSFQGPADVPGLARRMNERFFGRLLSASDEEILQQYMDSYPAPFDVFALYDSLALGAMLPSYQWY